MAVFTANTIIAACAAVFAYLSWVRMTTRNESDIQDEMHTRICNHRRPPDLNPEIYPTTAIVSERSDLKYRLLKSIVPFYSPQGVTRIEVGVIRPEEISIYRMRKDVFGEQSVYAGVRASDYDNPKQIILNYDSIEPEKVQRCFMESIRLLRGEYKLVISGDVDPKSIWDPKEEAP